jgi:hypothetical protein
VIRASAHPVKRPDPAVYPTSSDTNADRLRAFRKSLARWRQELSGTIAQCLNLEHEIHHTCSKLCILGFEPLNEPLK